MATIIDSQHTDQSGSGQAQSRAAGYGRGRRGKPRQGSRHPLRRADARSRSAVRPRRRAPHARNRRHSRDDVRKRLASVEQYAGTEAEALAQRIKGEYEARTTATKELSRQLQDTSSEFERRSGLIEDQLARAQRELRQQILDAQQQLSAEIRQKFDALLAELRQEAVDLRSVKADRGTLAALFTEIAMKLASDRPGGEEPRR